MKKQKLIAMLKSILGTKAVVETLGSENYPMQPFDDSDIREIFYSLNNMALLLYKKIDEIHEKNLI